VRPRLVTETAAAVALAAVLGLIKIPLPQLVNGGSVSLETLPVLIVACRHGARVGLLTGIGLALLNLLLEPVVIHPAQVLLDYPLAYGGLGWIAGLIGHPRGLAAPPAGWLARARVVAAIVAGNSVRLAAHFVSGTIFFAAYAPPGQAAWIYSLVYNASYLAPQLLLHILLLQLVFRLLTQHR
jgi:thiamine transporter